ncbi:MAG: tetratricopeptide repeat protein [Pseudomonadota bacterium]
MADIEAGRFAPAIIKLRAVLAAAPGAARARLELARALFLAGRWDASREEFLTVLSGETPAPVRANILTFIRQIDARRSVDWGLDVSVGLSPSHLRRYDTDIVNVSLFGVTLPAEATRPDEGDVTTQIDADIAFRRPLGVAIGDGALGAFVVASASGRFDDQRGLEARRLRLRTGGGLRATFPRTTVDGALAVSASFRDREHEEDIVTGELGANHRIGAGGSLFGGVVGGVAENHLDAGRSGPLIAAHFGGEQAIDARGSVGAVVRGERRFAEDEARSSTIGRATLFGRYDVGFGANARLEIYGEGMQEDGVVAPFVSTRREYEFGGDLKVTKRDWFLFNRFNPYLSVGGAARESSIDAFGYTEGRLRFGVERGF